MYIYHALINALSAHMIHINLNMIFYTHAEQSPTKTIYINYYIKNTNKMHYTHTHTHAHTHAHTHTLTVAETGSPPPPVFPSLAMLQLVGQTRQFLCKVQPIICDLLTG